MNSEATWAVGRWVDDNMLAFFYDNVSLQGAIYTGVIAFGFIGFIYWMTKQAKFNKEAEANSDQLK